MLDILSLLQCLLPQLEATTMKQLNQIILAMLLPSRSKIVESGYRYVEWYLLFELGTATVEFQKMLGFAFLPVLLSSQLADDAATSIAVSE